MTKIAYIALAGAPNAGKSTLLNQLIGTKVSIVSPKVQTTRVKVRGILAEGDTQLVLVDTPGLFQPKRTLEKRIVQEAQDGLGDVDVIALLVDAARAIKNVNEAIPKQLLHNKQRKILIVNKVDKLPVDRLLPLVQSLNDQLEFEQTFMVSALKGKGTKDVLKYFLSAAVDGPWLYDKDQMTDMPERLWAAEVTREKLFLTLQEELPYSVAVETELYQEQENGVLKIAQVIYVSKENQKKIIIGKQGATIKRIGTMARKELEPQLEKKIHLTLFVKVKENWVESIF